MADKKATEEDYSQQTQGNGQSQTNGSSNQNLASAPMDSDITAASQSVVEQQGLTVTPTTTGTQQLNRWRVKVAPPPENRAQSTRATVKGQTVTRGSADYNILKGVEKLQQEGLVTQNEDYSDVVMQATNLMGALIIAVEPVSSDLSSADYDLRESQTDVEVVSNPNLKDRDIKNLKKEKIPATDKFPCTEDAFYNLDPAPDQQTQAKRDDTQRKEEPSTAKKLLGGALAGLNMHQNQIAGAAFKY